MSVRRIFYTAHYAALMASHSTKGLHKPLYWYYTMGIYCASCHLRRTSRHSWFNGKDPVRHPEFPIKVLGITWIWKEQFCDVLPPYTLYFLLSLFSIIYIQKCAEIHKLQVRDVGGVHLKRTRQRHGPCPTFWKDNFETDFILIFHTIYNVKQSFSNYDWLDCV